MPRRPRICPAGTCFHVINRAVARLTLFEKQEDYEAFERVLALAHERVNLGIFAYCVMPNHWHFVVCPKTDTQVTDFFRWLTHTHTMRWHAHYLTEGTGHLYQGFAVLVNVLGFDLKMPRCFAQSSRAWWRRSMAVGSVEAPTKQQQA